MPFYPVRRPQETNGLIRTIPIEWVLPIVITAFAIPPLSASGQVLADGAFSGGMLSKAASKTAPYPSNPAYLALATKESVSVWITQMYELRELRLFGVSGNIRRKRAGVGLRVVSYGFDRFKEQRIELASGWMPKSDGKFPSMGAAIRYTRLTRSRKGYRASLLLTGGLRLPISESLELGWVIERTVRSEFRMESMMVGFAYHVTGHASLYCDIYLETGFPASFRSGFDAVLDAHLRVRGGFATEPNRFSIGFSIPFEWMSVHFAFIRHTLLGWSTAAEVTFSR